MIKLFRQSRQKLIMENNTSNYIKYAIGEVVLVVIGILLAIQLNQWRMESNNNNQKKIVLNALQLEFESNLKQLEKVIYYIEEVPKAYLIANKMINNNAIKYSAKDYEELIMGLGWVYTFNPSNGALRSAISSSEIHLIKNKRLIEVLFSWEDLIKDSDEEALTIRKYQYESLALKGQYISPAGEWENICDEMLPPKKTYDYLGLLKDEDFENYSVRSYAYAKEYLTELDDIKNQNGEILQLIKLELTK